MENIMEIIKFIVMIMAAVFLTILVVWGIVIFVEHSRDKTPKEEDQSKITIDELKQMSYDLMLNNFSTTHNSKVAFKLFKTIIELEKEVYGLNYYTYEAGNRARQLKKEESRIFYKDVLQELLNHMSEEDVNQIINYHLCYAIEQDENKVIEFFEDGHSIFRGTKEIAITTAKAQLNQKDYSAIGNGIYNVHELKGESKDE